VGLPRAVADGAGGIRELDGLAASDQRVLALVCHLEEGRDRDLHGDERPCAQTSPTQFSVRARSTTSSPSRTTSKATLLAPRPCASAWNEHARLRVRHHVDAAAVELDAEPAGARDRHRLREVFGAGRRGEREQSYEMRSSGVRCIRVSREQYAQRFEQEPCQRGKRSARFTARACPPRLHRALDGGLERRVTLVLVGRFRMEPRVEIASGRIEGSREDGVLVSGASPTPGRAGALRLRAPQPPERWAGVRETKSFGPAAPQNPGRLAALLAIRPRPSRRTRCCSTSGHPRRTPLGGRFWFGCMAAASPPARDPSPSTAGRGWRRAATRWW